MELRQKIELRKTLIPELSQSLNVLALPLLDLKNLIEKELQTNPLLEEIPSSVLPQRLKKESTLYPSDVKIGLITKKTTLQDVLLRQLGMFTNSDEDFRIGQEIIGNIDGNGYLQANLDEIASSLNVDASQVETVLKTIQDFEPAGVGARTISECLLIQLKVLGETGPLLIQIAENYLDDVAKKNYTHIAKSLKEPIEKIEPLIKKILKLDPKPGRNYSPDESQRIIPDIIIEERDEENLEVIINNEDVSMVGINKMYKQMLKNKDLNTEAREFLKQKLHYAMELIRAISRRNDTLRKVIEVIVEVQNEAIRENLSYLNPLTFKEVAGKINMHESTVCRAVMNKYVRTPNFGVIALKDLFSSHIHDQNGQNISSSHVKGLIKEIVDREDKRNPLSDHEISGIFSKEKNLKVSRRTVTKYREELKILSSVYRKVR